MGSYLIRRLLLMMLTLFGISVIIFVMLRVVPGNIADILFDAAGMVNPAEKQKLESRARPRQADPGAIRQLDRRSCTRRPRLRLCVRAAGARRDPAAHSRSPPSSPGWRSFFSVLFGVPLGVISAVRQNTPLDYVLRVISLSGLSLPSFWLGLLILMAFVHYFGWIPIYTEPARQPVGRAAAAQRAGGGGRLPRLRADHAADALVHARSAAPGLHPHRARQGRLRGHGQLRSRAAQRACCRSSPSSASRRRS